MSVVVRTVRAGVVSAAVVLVTAQPKLYRSPQWRRVRLEVLERDGHKCRLRMRKCTGVADQVDHIVRPDDGGSFFDPSNLRASCAWCNQSRGGSVGARQTNDVRSGYPPALEW